MADDPTKLTGAELETWLRNEARRVGTLPDREKFLLPTGASRSETKRAFMRTAAQWHPDKFSDAEPGIRTAATELFMLYSEAEARLVQRSPAALRPSVPRPKRKRRLQSSWGRPAKPTVPPEAKEPENKEAPDVKKKAAPEAPVPEPLESVPPPPRATVPPDNTVPPAVMMPPTSIPPNATKQSLAQRAHAAEVRAWTAESYVARLQDKIHRLRAQRNDARAQVNVLTDVRRAQKKEIKALKAELAALKGTDATG